MFFLLFIALAILFHNTGIIYISFMSIIKKTGFFQNSFRQIHLYSNKLQVNVHTITSVR